MDLCRVVAGGVEGEFAMEYFANAKRQGRRFKRDAQLADCWMGVDENEQCRTIRDKVSVQLWQLTAEGGCYFVPTRIQREIKPSNGLALSRRRHCCRCGAKRRSRQLRSRRPAPTSG